jgi:Na+/H+-dicarboxylate symporter
MCADTRTTKSKFQATIVIYLMMIALGLFSGLSQVEFLHQLGQIIADIFIKIFRCISLPIIALSLIVTLAGIGSEQSMTKTWQRTIFYTLTTTLIAATVSCILYLLINPSSANLQHMVPQGPVSQTTNYWDYLASLIPANVFAPFLEHQVVGVLLVGIVIGLAIRFIPQQQPRESVLHFFQGVHGIFLVITRWVVAIIPLGLYGFITVTVVQLNKGSDIKGIGEYLTIVVLANLVQGFLVLPLWLKMNGIAPFTTMRKMMPALSVAFFTKSSAGTLPITIETAEKQLNINPKISRFVLPLCTSINMNGCAAFIFATVIYLMQNSGIEITLGTMALWIMIATIAAIGNAGVPMGCFFLSTSLLVSMDVPITLLGFIAPFYAVIDMIETALNVWSDSCVATVVNERQTADVADGVTSPVS